MNTARREHCAARTLRGANTARHEHCAARTLRGTNIARREHCAARALCSANTARRGLTRGHFAARTPDNDGEHQVEVVRCNNHGCIIYMVHTGNKHAPMSVGVAARRRALSYGSGLEYRAAHWRSSPFCNRSVVEHPLRKHKAAGSIPVDRPVERGLEKPWLGQPAKQS